MVLNTTDDCYSCLVNAYRNTSRGSAQKVAFSTEDSLLLVNLGGVLPLRTCYYAHELWEEQHCITYYIHTVGE